MATATAGRGAAPDLTDDPQFVGVTMGFQVYQWNRLSNPVFATHVAP